MPLPGPKDRHAILLTLDRRIAARRKARWLWQRDLATTLGLTTAYICLVEKGRRGVSYMTVVQIARALGVSAAWLASPAADEPQEDGRRPVLRKPREPKKTTVRTRRAQRQLLVRLRDRIRQRRPSKGLTLRELAGRAGLSVPYLSAMERGARDPPYLRVVGIARALGTKVRRLVPD